MSTTDYTPGQVYEVDPATLTIGTNVRTHVAERDEFAQVGQGPRRAGADHRLRR